MTTLHVLAPNLAFLSLALLAGGIAALAADRGPDSAPRALNIGALVVLGQLAAVAVFAGFGLPLAIARGAALVVGTAAAWTADDSGR